MRLIISTLMAMLMAALIFSCGAFCQQQTGNPPAMSDEEVVAIFNRISARVARIEPMLEQLHPNDWIAKGAPDTYLAQWNSVREQFTAIKSDMADLAQHP